jgi:NAD(P)-dependent dehydrogenase (short-subunit alcohol dehydrogenase family)
MTKSVQQIQWDESCVPHLDGKTFIVTGGNSGLGLENVRVLASHGAHVVMACRNTDKGKNVLETLGDASRNVDVRELDLASLQSVRNFAAELPYSSIDVLINNAGVMAPPRTLTDDGFELQFGTNHLGHFALTLLLLDKIHPTTGRVVTVSSNAHKAGNINFDDLMYSERYSAWGAYAQSKLANLLFAFELQRLLIQSKSKIVSVAAHPGYSATNLSLSVMPSVKGFFRQQFRKFEQVIAQPAHMGALPQLYAALADEVVGAGYYGPDGLGEWSGYPKAVTPIAKARNQELAERLWMVSEVLTQQRYSL